MERPTTRAKCEKCGNLAKTGIDGDYLRTKKLGKAPFTTESLGNMISIACAAVGFPGYSCHGLRHLAGAALAEAGATVDEISVLGHTTQEMARLYVQQANRNIMAKNANGNRQRTKWLTRAQS
jgi:integrase